MSSTQLPLGINLQFSQSFANYNATFNHTALLVLRQVIARQSENSLYLWGESGTGKTHLLQAACQEMTYFDQTPAYIPLSELKSEGTMILEGLDSLDLVCLDDLQVIVGFNDWERALFNLFNLLKDHNIPLLMTGNAAPNDLGLKLLDLESRLSWGGVFKLQCLDNKEKIKALQQHAKQLGFELPEKVARYLLKQFAYDLETLIQQLRSLDYASLAAHRKITLPFVRQWLTTLASPPP
jgi:DnaA family protein